MMMTIEEVMNIFRNTFLVSIISPIKYYEKIDHLFYKESSFNFKSSTTAPALPLTPNFCMVLEI